MTCINSSYEDASSCPGRRCASFAVKPHGDALHCLLPTVARDVQHILICGWSDTTFMCWLLRELDSGPVRMAAGSRVTLLNTHSTDEIMEQARRGHASSRATACACRQASQA